MPREEYIKKIVSVTCAGFLFFALCTPEDNDKGPDPDPSVNDGGADSISDTAKLMGDFEIGVPAVFAFDEYSHHLYKFSIGESAVVNISLKGEDNPDLDTVLRLYGPYDENGYLTEYPVKYDDDGGEGLSSFIEGFGFPSEGTYAVVASTYAGRPAAGKRYRLLVECVSESCEGTTIEPYSINIEVDFFMDGPASLLPESLDYIINLYTGLGIRLEFHPDDIIEEEVYGITIDYSEFKDAYFAYYDHRGEDGWHYMLVTGYPLDGGGIGWGRLGGDMCVIHNEWYQYEGERKVNEMIYLFMHEFGHNMGLIHEGFDIENPHDYSNCVMPSGTGRIRSIMPAVVYCPSCIEHINPITKPAW